MIRGWISSGSIGDGIWSLAAEAPPAAPKSSGGFESILPMIIIMGVVMYLMIVLSNRQRKKQEKERKDMLSSVKKGDEVETGGGIIGEIMNIDDKYYQIQIDKKKDVRVRFRKDMVRRVVSSKKKN